MLTKSLGRSRAGDRRGLASVRGRWLGNVRRMALPWLGIGRVWAWRTTRREAAAKASLAGEMFRERTRHDPAADVERVPEPDHSPIGAQWNEIKGRWERWATDHWEPVAD
jgi:hypothetical protein